jgi:predicted Zn-dependent peptidase
LLFELNSSLSFTAEAAQVSRTVLPSGVRILSEQIIGAPSVAIAFSVGVGSRDEVDGQFGATHFLEHLLFKGTANRSAQDISEAFDSVGGSSNAATSKEYTSYYARVQNSALPLAVSVLADMFTSAIITEADFNTERTVILEELAMNEDDPEDVAHEALAAALLPAHELGRPIGGTPETIRAVTRESVWRHYRAHYQPSQLVVTAAGGVDHQELVSLVSAAIAEAGWGGISAAAPRREAKPVPALSPSRFVALGKPVAQANLLIGKPSIAAYDPRRFALGVLNTILGGGMSSRLYQKIREQRGLAYSTYSYHHPYSDLGYFGMYAGCAPENAEQVVGLMLAELADLAGAGPTEKELALARGNISGSLALRFESSMARMNRLLAAELGSGEFLTLQESIERFNAVTADQVRELAAMLAGQPGSLVAVGPNGVERLESLAASV